ncbi:MAG: hypothetical protein BWY71_01814 [Planctomycetes bacterium ADurb.Bin412]|nr:MAG: hypothetical protein BWY71_01814 [Planctomycetes bacterium ADurb.Bin412]
MPGVIDNRYPQIGAFLNCIQYRGILQHVPGPADAALESGLIDFIGELAAQQPGQPGAAPGHIMQRQIGANRGSAEIASLPGYILQVAVLAGGDKILVAAELRRIDTQRAVIVAGVPFAIRAFYRQESMGRKIAGRAVERIGHIIARAIFFKGRVADVMAGPAQSRFPMEWRNQDRVAAGGVHKRASPRTGGVHHRHAVGIYLARKTQGRQNIDIFDRILFAIKGVHQPVAEIAGNPAHIRAEHLAAVGGNRTALEPAAGQVAAQADVAGVGGVLIGDGHIGFEQQIARGLGHHAAFPVVKWFHAGVVIAMTRGAGVGRIQNPSLERLAAGLVEVPQGSGGHPARWRLNRENAVAVVCIAVEGVVGGLDAKDSLGSGPIGGEPGIQAGIR